MNARTRQAIDGAALLGGVFCIALGLLFLVDQLQIAHFGRLMNSYWPLIIVIVGIPKLFDAQTIWSGLWLIGIGAWIQAAHLHLYDLTYSNSWPLLLILWGAGMVLRTLIESIRRGGGSNPEERHEP